MLKFCPECGSKYSGGKFCGACGADLTKYLGGVGASNVGGDSAQSGGVSIDDAISNLFGLTEDKNIKDKLRTLIIRKKYKEAEELCNSLIDDDPMNMTAYIGLIRIASKNFQQYDDNVEEQVTIAEDMFGMDELLKYEEFAKFIAMRKGYYEDVEYRRLEKFALDSLVLEPNSDGTYTVTGVKNTELITNIAIPRNVTAIGESAFKCCDFLESIIIPNSVTSIRDQAFCHCSSLIGVTIPDSVTYIGKKAFWNCTSLSDVTIPNSVTSIREGAFSGCDSLTKAIIPDSVTYIGKEAFCNCTSLSDVTIPNSVTSIREGAFSGCDSLTKAIIPASVTNIGEKAFWRCKSLTSVTMLAGITSIEKDAFWGCKSLTDVKIPDSVTSIDSGAFVGTSLASVSLPSGGGMFYRCLRRDSFPENCEITYRTKK